MDNNKKTIDPELLEKLTELHKESKYINWMDDHLLEKLRCHMTVFTMAMERAGSSGWDVPDQEEMNDLSYFWGDLEANLSVAIELLDMSSDVLRGKDYDPSKKGRYLRYDTLNRKLKLWKKENK